MTHTNAQLAGPSRPGGGPSPGGDAPSPDQQILNVAEFVARELGVRAFQLSMTARRVALWTAFRVVACEPIDLARAFGRHRNSVYRDLARVDAKRRRDPEAAKALDALLLRAERALGTEG